MSEEPEIFVMEDIAEEEPPKKAKAKGKKPKKELTEEQKQKLRDQLKKGRETALKNRQKKALVNKIKRKEKEEENDKLIANSVLKQNTSKETLDALKSEIESLKNMVGELKEKPKKERPPTPINKDAPQIEMKIEEKPQPIIEEAPKPKTVENPKPVPPKPVAPPPPRQPLVISTRRNKRNEFF